MSKGFLTADQREQLSTYPKSISNTDLGRFFTLTSTDLLQVSQQRSDHNRIGFALQLCTLREQHLAGCSVCPTTTQQHRF